MEAKRKGHIMKLLLINPNTSDGFTSIAQKAADVYKNKDTIVKAVSSPCGPLTLEGYFDEIISSVGVLEVVQREKENYDGFIVACFSNHFSIYAARQITEKPVVGIFEPPMLLAKQLGARFSIVTPSPRWKPLLEEGLEAVGMKQSCASIRVIGLDVEEFECMEQEKLEIYLSEEAKKAVKEDGAEVIVLGCCGLAGFDMRLRERLDIPVLDPVASAVKVLEDLVDLKMSTSRVMSYSSVIPQEYKNVPEVFHPLYEGSDSTQM